MEQIVIEGGRSLSGTVTSSGSKNSCLALMSAALLAPEPCVLENVPRLRDVETMSQILRALGADVEWESSHRLRIDATQVSRPEAPYELVRQMRASFLVLGPLTARFGLARVSEPGGCAIGVRPVDQHTKALAALGAKIKLDHGYVEASSAGLRGNTFRFDLVTVNGTQNAMMAAALAKGTTRLENAACEPEVIELAQVLRRMGIEVVGEGTPQIEIQGSPVARGFTHRVSSDRIEAGTLLAAAAITGGEIRLEGANPSHMGSTLEVLQRIGCELRVESNVVSLKGPEVVQPITLETGPYPAFPTDMQAQVLALLCVAEGVSVVEERIFENRYMHVPELQRMGAKIRVEGSRAQVEGVSKLMAAPVMATDLRASAGLVVAALAALGETRVSRVYHIDRGYERLEEKLRMLGASIRREA